MVKWAEASSPMRKPGWNRKRAFLAGAFVACSAAAAFSQSPVQPFAPAAAVSTFHRVVALLFSLPVKFPPVPQIAPPAPTKPIPAALSPAAVAPAAKLIIKADYKERLDNLLTASGNVEIRSGDLILYADQVVFDETTKDALAVGHVSLIRPGEAFTADRFALNLETGLGKAENVVGLVDPQYRYESVGIERINPEEFRLGQSSITGCTQPVPKWKFSASRAEIRRGEYIKMWDPVFRIKDVPVFYLPYIKYPLNQDRSTGFLIPRAGYSGRKGFILSQQFYWAIARNMDATFSLDFYSTKGAGGGLEFRYLFPGGWGGQLNAYYFVYRPPETGVKPDDAVVLRWSHHQTLPGKINFVANVDYQSSFSFSREFDSNYGRALIYNRSSEVYLTKNWGGSNLSARIGRFETSFPSLGINIIRRSVPQISYSLFKKKLVGPVYFSLSSGYSNWEYGYLAQYKAGTQVKSSALYFSPKLSLPFNEIPWLSLDMSVSGELNYYGNSKDPVTQNSVDKGLLSGTGSFSISATGPVFYRIYHSDKSSKRIKHTISPTISYRYDTPTIDSSRIITPRGYFFRYHYLTYSLQNQLLSKIGEKSPREVLTWTIAQTYYLDAKDSPLSRFTLDDGRVPQFTEITNNLRFFPSAGINLDVSLGYNTYKKMLSSVRASGGLGNPSDNLYFSASWYKGYNPYYESSRYNREQLGFRGGAKIPWIQMDVLGDLEFNVAQKKLLYSGLAAVWHFQCLDVKMNVRAFFFRATPEVQFQLSLGLGNIGSSSEFLSGRDL